MSYPLQKALERYLDPHLPKWGEAESEIDPPTWQVSALECDPSLPGEGLKRHSMLLIGEETNRMYLVHQGKVIWTYDAGKGWEFDEVWMLRSGNILFSHMYWAAEITPDKRFAWRMDAPEGTEIHGLQPIDEDRILLVINALPLPRLQILNKKTGIVEMEHEIPYDACDHPHGQFRHFRMTAEGTFLAPCLCMERVIEFDRNFEPIWSYDIGGPWAAIRLHNGNTLISSVREFTTREVNRQGETVWEYRIEDIPEPWRFSVSQSCVRLANGNTILCSQGDGGTKPQLMEVTPDKEIVWVLNDWKNLGPCTAVQILTEPDIPEVPGSCQR